MSLWVAGLDKIFDVELDRLLDIGQGLFRPVTPGVTASQRWTIGVVGFVPVLKRVFLDDYLEDVGLHINLIILVSGFSLLTSSSSLPAPSGFSPA
jgi:hypothetical protein